MKQGVTLEYMLGEGWLTFWLDGLRKGEAVASTCSTCEEAHFPPLRVCPTCRTTCDGWRNLNGGATIVFRTTGTDGDFAFACFDGASGAAIAQADALPPGATRGRLAPCDSDPPRLALIPEAPT